MNSNRVPLAPLTALQIQQLARQSKSKNTYVFYKNQSQNITCQDINQIYRKIILELLNSKQEPFPEFLYGVHIEYKQKINLHICPTKLLVKILNEQYSIKEAYCIYQQIYSQTNQIKVYIDISEIDLIISLLSIIVNNKLDLSRNREVFRKQSVQDLVNLRKLVIEDPKIKQVVSMVQYIYNSSQIKLSGHTLVKFEKNPPISRDQYFQYISRNIHRIATDAFLKYCSNNQILIPEILLFLKLKGDEIIIDDYDFILTIPDSQLFNPLKGIIRYDKFQRITTLQSLIEYEYFLITTLDIIYPMQTITNTIVQLVNQIDMNFNFCLVRLQRVVNDPSFETLLLDFTQSQNPLVQNILTTLLRLSHHKKQNIRMPKLKLKITKS